MKEMNRIQIPQSLEDVCSNERPALIVYDMQVGILRQLKDGDVVLENVIRVVNAARQAGLRIFFLRHMSLRLKLMGAFHFRMAMAWQRLDDLKRFVVVAPRSLLPRPLPEWINSVRIVWGHWPGTRLCCLVCG